MAVGKCYICGADLVFDKDKPNCEMNDLDGNINKELRCPHCGTTYSSYTKKDEKVKESCDGFNDQGFGRCFECGGTLMWSGDFMRSDFCDDISDEDDEIVRNLICSHCYASYDVYELTEKEKKDYPYWNEKH